MRAVFRARMQSACAAEVWRAFPGRIAAVLFGGGAQGAYQAGALLAFQDAAIPTPIITGASVGSINAASYAAHSDTLVGNAEPLVDSWFEVTPPAVGIEWTRYAWTLTGLVVAIVGFSHLVGHALVSYGFDIGLHDPELTWISFAVAGTFVLLFHDRLPYIGYVAQGLLWPSPWKFDVRKAALSLVANLIVWGALLIALYSLHLHILIAKMHFHPDRTFFIVGAFLLLLGLRYAFRTRISAFLHRALRFTLRPGLFPNFERSRLLRHQISVEGLRASPMHVIFSVISLNAGAARLFCNRPLEELAAGGVDRLEAIAYEMRSTDDFIAAITASSALPIAYEPVEFEGSMYADGGIIAEQTIRLPVRLGADILLLVRMDAAEYAGDLKTFIDVGMRALDILRAQNLMSALKALEEVNAVCERVAAGIGVRPSEVEVDLGNCSYRFVKTLTVRPSAPLAGGMLDFSRKTIGPAILQGYRDATVQIEKLLTYARQEKPTVPRRILTLALGDVPIRR
jgi:predicted acylesterase/phospholipase RssA